MLAPLVTRETNRDACPFDKLSWWNCSDLEVRTITSWGSGKSVGSSVM